MIASPHLARLGAYARPAGGPGTAAARRYCRSVLEPLGFAIREQEFEYSAFGGARAMPVLGVAIPLAATAAVAARASHPWLAAVAAAALCVAMALVAYAGGAGVLGLPMMRRRGTNLVATRGAEEPLGWLVAHIDSKWQPVSMIVRVGGIVLSGVALAGVIVATIAGSPAASPLVVLLWLAALPLMLSVVGARNHGTVDNASGVAAVLDAVERLPADLRIGVLITDAEELALAGARAWARGRMAGLGFALNCDSIDDAGPLTAMYTGARERQADLLAALSMGAAAEGEPFRAMRLLPGVLADSVALAGAGWRSVTLSRGTVRTLGRIHTSRDTLDAMRGTGIPGAA
ncbi:MAG: M28 family peptidase, partial [Gemmatimonadales bacterium]